MAFLLSHHCASIPSGVLFHVYLGLASDQQMICRVTEHPHCRGTRQPQGSILSPMNHGCRRTHRRLTVPESYVEVPDRDKGMYRDPEDHISGMEHLTLAQ
jgi:hypothetical protein